jgi:ABC-2 type transport system permease protein
VISVLTAERIKFTSVRSPWWCSLIIVTIGLGMAALMGWLGKQAVTDPATAEGFPGLTVDVAAGGVSGFGIMVLMILAALTVTSEYRFGIIRTTFQAVPSRVNVLVAKGLLTGGYGAALTFVLAFVAYYVAKAVAGTDGSVDLVLSSADDWRKLYGIPIYAALCALLAIAVGALLRQSAAAIALLLLWPLLIENLFPLFGSVGDKVRPFLPFANAQHFLGAELDIDFHWGPWGGLAYFVAFVAIAFVAAAYTVTRRDA